MSNTTDHTSQETSFISLSIKGDWNSHDFIWLFCLLEELEFYVQRIKKIVPVSPFNVDRLKYGIEKVPGKLKVESFEYPSPGLIKVALSQTAANGVARFLSHYVAVWEQKNEAEKLSSELLKIEVDNLVKLDFSQDEINQVMRPQVERVFGYISHIYSNAFSGVISAIALGE